MRLTPIPNSEFSIDTLHRAYRLLDESPDRLTETEIRHLLCYDPRAEERIGQARLKAMWGTRLDATRAQQAPGPEMPADVARMAPIPEEVEGFVQALVDALDKGKRDAWERYVEANAERAVPLFMFDGLVRFCGAINTRNKERNARHDEHERRDAEIERRLAALEAQPKALTFKGGWADGVTYEPNDVVSYGGSMWVCTARNSMRPNDTSVPPPRPWTLAVKKGTDGRDLRDG